MSESRQRRIAELSKLIESHSATQAETAWDALRRAFNACIRNAAELVALIEHPQDHPEVAIHILRVDQPEVMDEYFDELFRHLLNYTASVSALRDYARNLMKDYPTGSFRFEYDSRVANLIAVEEVHFVQDLRNYLQHNRVPPLQIQYSLTDQEVDNTGFTIHLNSEKLLRSKKWSSASKSFLRSRESVVLADVVKTYTEKNTELYQWFFTRFTEAHPVEAQELRQLRQELRRLLSLADDQSITYRKSGS